MQHYTYQPQGVCSRQIDFDIKDNKIYNLVVTGGCNGNLKGIATLVDGQDINLIKDKLKGINCNGRGTSCPDQLSLAIEEYQNIIKRV